MSDLVERLRRHDDERLYAEADYLMAEAADEITRLRAEVEALRADAERYRWLRATTNTATNSKGERIDVRNMPDRWDAAIDKARKA